MQAATMKKSAWRFMPAWMAFCVPCAVHAQSVSVVAFGNIVSKTCSVDTTDVTIDMGSMPIEQINEVDVGATVPKSSTGNIHVTCNTAGMTLSFTMTDASNPASTLAYLTLTPGSGAQGVGIQMFRDDGTAIPLGPAASWVATTDTPAGAFTLPVVARYYHASNPVRPGTVSARSIFTITYK